MLLDNSLNDSFSISIAVICSAEISCKKSLPTVVTLDIYIWHRFVFFILTVMGVTQFMFSFDALGVFLINAIIAFAFRFAYSKKK